MKDAAAALAPLHDALGHRFERADLLAEALTHPSARSRRGAAKRGYERLEFLGDRVLGLIIAELLWRRFPDEAEGALTRRHTSLVRRETLTGVAKEIGLGAHIVVSAGEETAGARANPSVLADVFEAVIAALYLDGGLAVARSFVERWWEQRLTRLGAPPRNPKTALQEWAQARSRALPVYRTVAAEGPAHRRVFTVTVTVDGLPPASATGSSKRSAETAAAAAALAAIGGAT